MDNDIKQKAERLTKNAEMKIQKANEKEAKYQQEFELQNKSNPNLIDYDKEPLILRDYSGFPLILHNLAIFVFWIAASVFVIEFLDDFESGNLDLIQTEQTLIKFGSIVVLFLIFDYFNIIKSKKKYTYYYASKVVYRDENFKETGTENLCNKDKIIKAIWFLDMVFTTSFGKIFLACFLMVNFLKGAFVVSLVGAFILIFILFIAEFLEILVFTAIYKQSNKSLKNFWKYFPKFQINIERKENIHWSDYHRYDEPLYSIHLFLFNEQDYDKARDYILAVFNIDINKNLNKQQQFQKFF